MAEPPLARLVPRSPAQHACATAHALIGWSLCALERLAAGVLLVVPVLLLAGLVFALAITVTGPSRRWQPMLVAPPPPSPDALRGLCSHSDPMARDACWGALFERIERPQPPGSVTPSAR